MDCMLLGKKKEKRKRVAVQEPPAHKAKSTWVEGLACSIHKGGSGALARCVASRARSQPAEREVCKQASRHMEHVELARSRHMDGACIQSKHMEQT
eukprot:1147703-Pelagomonas_calceolata.AAC.5